mmetsp:Transcript_60383/g.156142  ORF Transcript_60383/g.156142 Transcript_60383/m.156142 type:complete len:82 (-) Transcript_60383:222-467(-)
MCCAWTLCQATTVSPYVRSGQITKSDSGVEGTKATCSLPGVHGSNTAVAAADGSPVEGKAALALCLVGAARMARPHGQESL